MRTERVATIALIEGLQNAAGGGLASAEREYVTRWSSRQDISCIGRHGGVAKYFSFPRQSSRPFEAAVA